MASETIELKVGAASNPKKLAWSVFEYINEGAKVELAAVGAAAVNQMVKAVTIARGHCAKNGTDLLFKTGFKDVTIEGDQKTAIRLMVIVT